MDYEIKTTKASPQLIAAVRARVPRGGVAQAYRDSLDKVWEFLRGHPGLRTDGHNLFLYHHEAAESGFMPVDFGGQAVREFRPEPDATWVETPGGGRVTPLQPAPTAHPRGAPTTTPAWCLENGHEI